MGKLSLASIIGHVSTTAPFSQSTTATCPAVGTLTKILSPLLANWNDSGWPLSSTSATLVPFSVSMTSIALTLVHVGALGGTVITNIIRVHFELHLVVEP